MSDLRSFLDALRRERPQEIVDVQREVCPRHETVAILTRFEQSYRSPILFFHRVAGCKFPVVTNVSGSLNRLAFALGCARRELTDVYGQRCGRPVKPQRTTAAAAQQIVLRGTQVDLSTFPQLIYHEGDAPHPYITAAIVAARDPDSGKTNLSYHRLMISGRNTTGIFMERGKHLDLIYRKYEKAGQVMPIAAFLGAHPLWSMGALFTGSPDVEEYDVIGGLFGKPLDVVECVTQPGLCVPANAEFVLEGFVPPHERTDEGPFGEFTGYSTGRAPAPVFHVEAITSRCDPIFQDIASGHMEHLILPLPGIEHHLLSTARAIAPGVKRVKMEVPLTVFVQLEKKDDSEPSRLAGALLQSDIFTKQVIVLDPDVDLADLTQVMTAVALRVRPDRDVWIFPDQLGTSLDPSCESAEGRTAKIGIDATSPLVSKRRLVKNSVPQKILDSIHLSEFLGKPKPGDPA